MLYEDSFLLWHQNHLFSFKEMILLSEGFRQSYLPFWPYDAPIDHGYGFHTIGIRILPMVRMSLFGFPSEDMENLGEEY